MTGPPVLPYVLGTRQALDLSLIRPFSKPKKFVCWESIFAMTPVTLVPASSKMFYCKQTCTTVILVVMQCVSGHVVLLVVREEWMTVARQSVCSWYLC